MAVPFRRTSKMIKRKRRSHLALKPADLIKCTNCDQNIQQHRVCEHCGFYKGKKVVTVKNDK